jgi:Tfp pilus assembly protein PilO
LRRLKPLLLVGAAVFVLANVVLTRMYADSVAAYQATRQELATTQRQLDELDAPPDIGEIAHLLSEFQTQIKVAEKNIPPDSGSFDLLFALSRSASDSGVTISRLKAEPITKEKLTLEYWVTRYSVEASGASPAITNFVERVEKLPHSTLMLDNIALKPLGNQWLLTFQVSVLSREEPRSFGAGPAAPPIRTDAATPMPRP